LSHFVEEGLCGFSTKQFGVPVDVVEAIHWYRRTQAAGWLSTADD